MLVLVLVLVLDRWRDTRMPSRTSSRLAPALTVSLVALVALATSGCPGSSEPPTPPPPVSPPPNGAASPASAGPAPAGDWYPKDVTPPAGTQYPCALTALPDGLPGIPEGERVYVNHVYAMILKLVQAKLVALRAFDGASGHDAALAAYRSESQTALARIKGESPPAGLEKFQAAVVGSIELLDSFFADACQLRKAGKSWDDVWKIPAGHKASAQLRGAWNEMAAHYPRWSAETRESIFHHLCALDLF